MITKSRYFDNELEALEEIKIRKQENPEKIHSVKFEDGNLTVFSFSLDDYIDEIYYKQTGERPSNTSSKIINFYNTFLGALPFGKSSRKS
jgi:hypothetical protein